MNPGGECLRRFGGMLACGGEKGSGGGGNQAIIEADFHDGGAGIYPGGFSSSTQMIKFNTPQAPFMRLLPAYLHSHSIILPPPSGSPS